MYVNSDYIESVLNNGGIPMAIPAVAMKADPEGILAVCDGILVPGGEDLNPWYYGEEPKPQIQTIRPEIDEAWFALGRAAKEMGMPMLGICKGIQFLNVLCGGDLYQDIYTQKETTILHLQSLERSYLHHHVEIKEGTHLAEILGAGTHAVNSMHHQAVRTPGEDIVVSATAPDGTIEAIESRNGQIVAVQWHPEADPLSAGDEPPFCGSGRKKQQIQREKATTWSYVKGKKNRDGTFEPLRKNENG
mgnify:FL=1